MIEELAKHIKKLLTENDCAILPGVGGFIAQYVPAHKAEHESVFMPPSRAIAFNAQLNLNDGMLAQSYMQANDTNYPKAQQWVEDAIADLEEALTQDGVVKIAEVGTLAQAIEGTLEFTPEAKDFFSPALYGLSPFEMTELAEQEPAPMQPATRGKHKQRRNALVIHINRTWLHGAAAVAATVVLFFVLSSPVGNTYIEPENYASLSNVTLFDNIRTQSMVTSLVRLSQSKPAPVQKRVRTPQTASNEPARTPDVAIEQTTTAATQKPIHTEVLNTTATPTVAKSGTCYYIIISSVPNRADAEKSLRFFASKGYADASIVEGSGRMRIAHSVYADKKEAEARCKELRQQEIFRDAWIFASRAQH